MGVATSMLVVGKRIAAGSSLAPALLRRAATIELDWDARQKSRFETEDSAGRRLAIVLPRGSVLRGGDVLVADDGSLVAVVAKPQPVSRVRVPPGGAASLLARAAYHLGNRHVALEVGADALQLEPDHVLAAMLRRMGLEVSTLDAPFEPEAGAYSGSHATSRRGHDHPDRDDHDHDHGHGHDHDHDHDQDHDHGHGDETP